MSRIAVIEDDAEVRRAIVAVLERRGFEVQQFANRNEALDSLKAIPPDLMIVDVLLPDGSGLDLVTLVRQSSGQRVPSIVVSGLDEEQDLLRGFDAGAVDYVAKPFSLDDLMARVKVHLARVNQRAEVQTAERVDPELVPMIDGLAFGRYGLLRELGRGGYGAVFLAADTKKNDALVALKVPAPQVDDGHAQARFVRETYTLACVKEEHVVRILDVGFVKGRPFYAMEYIEGESLFARVSRSGPLDEASARAMCRGLLKALRAVEQAGVLHRDIKPGNVVLRGGDLARPVLVDFGLARLRVDVGLTDANLLMGTVDFLAPEVIRDGQADHRSDLFALGLTLRFALSGEGLFPHLKGPELLEAIAQGPIPPAPASLSPVFAAFLANLVECDPTDRPRNAGAALTALEAIEATTPCVQPRSGAANESARSETRARQRPRRG